jgi:hypothetical protein
VRTLNTQFDGRTEAEISKDQREFNLYMSNPDAYLRTFNKVDGNQINKSDIIRFLNKKNNGSTAIHGTNNYVARKMYVEWCNDMAAKGTPRTGTQATAEFGTWKGLGLSRFNKYGLKRTGKGIKYGKGIEIEPKQKKEPYIIYGKFVIHLPQLKQNILNVKYASIAAIREFPRSQITDNFRDVIIDILNEGKINTRDLNILSEAERDLLTRITIKAGLSNLLPSDKKIIGNGISLSITDTDKNDLPKTDKAKSNKSDDVNAMIERFNLIRGEIVAGNNNKDILKELKQLLLKLMSLKKIDQTEGYEILNSII